MLYTAIAAPPRDSSPPGLPCRTCTATAAHTRTSPTACSGCTARRGRWRVSTCAPSSSGRPQAEHVAGQGVASGARRGARCVHIPVAHLPQEHFQSPDQDMMAGVPLFLLILLQSPCGSAHRHHDGQMSGGCGPCPPRHPERVGADDQARGQPDQPATNAAQALGACMTAPQAASGPPRAL